MNAARQNYGISRIDQPNKKNHGYYVRIACHGRNYRKYFPDKSSGGKSDALKKAREFRDALLLKLPRSKQMAAARMSRKVPQSGVVGVTHVLCRVPDGNEYEYWQAAWMEPDGKRRTARYSINRYGSRRALELAKQARRRKFRVLPVEREEGSNHAKRDCFALN